MPSLDIATRETHAPVNELTVVAKRHPGRWLAALVVLLVAAALVRSVMQNPRFQWDVVNLYLRDFSIGKGLWLTIWLTAVSMAISVVLGVLIAVMRLSANPVLRAGAFAYVWFFRGTPLLVQLLFWYNVAALYPVISFGLPGVHLNANHLITPLTAAILGLGLNQGAYQSEIVRAGIISVDHGQGEAAAALGLTRGQTMRRIVLPQAMRVIVPPTGNETISMLKNTSLVSVLAVPDLLYSAQIIYNRTFQPIPLLLIACIWYLVVTTVLTVGQYYVERRFARGNHVLPSTPWQRMRTLLKTHTPMAKGSAR
ncbi:amino acid ABC transporter permease [Streptomyces iranensis]|uniref:Amino acid ABC transporter n=1 Tax=Streptomyces iranensis TaxID=576784 RepID=A0A061A3Y3_9ACTN|nr:amino acid ABC transporter permease [Streptomyces iranensis]MBP2064946.1 polar amino acid transport system permease protein [Streptomyces iranensis]CDR10109.1 amino acid ABC transporter [Streptomyces iranensis]